MCSRLSRYRPSFLGNRPEGELEDSWASWAPAASGEHEEASGATLMSRARPIPPPTGRANLKALPGSVASAYQQLSHFLPIAHHELPQSRPLGATCPPNCLQSPPAAAWLRRCCLRQDSIELGSAPSGHLQEPGCRASEHPRRVG